MFNKEDYSGFLRQLQQVQVDTQQTLAMIAALVEKEEIKAQLAEIADSKQRHTQMLEDLILIIESPR